MRFRMVCAAICGVVLVCSHGRAEDAKPAQKTLKQPGGIPTRTPAVIRLAEGTDTEKTAESLRKLFPEKTVIVPLPDESALLVYVTQAELKKIQKALAGDLPGATAKFEFRMKDAKWDAVLDWYANTSGLVLTTAVKPEKGTFTFTPAKADQRFTIAEITDIINDALASHHLILVRRQKSFFLHAADEKLPPDAIQQISLKDLPTRARTDIVEVSITLKTMDAVEIKDEVRKLLSPWGEITLAKGKLLILRDTAGNIARIVRVLGEIEKADEPKPKAPLGVTDSKRERK